MIGTCRAGLNTARTASILNDFCRSSAGGVPVSVLMAKPRHLSPATSLQSRQVSETGNGLPLASMSVSNTRGLVLGSHYFVSSGGAASRPALSYPVPMGPTPPPTAPEAWGSDTLTPTHRPGSRSTINACGWRFSAPRRFEASKTSLGARPSIGADRVTGAAQKVAQAEVPKGPSPGLQWRPQNQALLRATPAPGWRAATWRPSRA